MKTDSNLNTDQQACTMRIETMRSASAGMALQLSGMPAAGQWPPIG